MRRAAVVLLLTGLACCISKPVVWIDKPEIFWIPALAENDDQLCVSLSAFPGEKCVSVGEIRRYVFSVKAAPDQ